MAGLTERQKMLLMKAIDLLNDAGGYTTIQWDVKGYDGCEFDCGCLADDLKIEFEIED